MENFELTFVLTVKEANAILGVLGKLPYEQSAGLISKLQQQAQPQLANAPQEVAEEVEAAE